MEACFEYFNYNLDMLSRFKKWLEYTFNRYRIVSAKYRMSGALALQNTIPNDYPPDILEADNKKFPDENQTDTASNSSVTPADNQPDEGYAETPTGYQPDEIIYDNHNWNSDTNETSPSGNTDNTIIEPATEGELTMIASPFIDCNSIDEAAVITGFGFSVPDSVNGNNIDSISTISREIIQVIYGASYDNSTYIRKAEGSDDISGDYNTYRQKKQITVNGSTVALKGNNCKINVATWSSNGYSYSITCKGFDESYITDIIAMVE